MSQPETNPYASPAIASEPAVPALVPTGPSELATRWQRFAGALIDSLIGFPLGLTVGVAIVLVASRYQVDMTTLNFRVRMAAFGVIGGGALFLALHGYLLATRGQTIGKYFMNTQIVSNDGKIMPLFTVFTLRYLPLMLVSQIPVMGGLAGLANALAIFRESRKCFHDDIAGTKVIQLPLR